MTTNRVTTPQEQTPVLGVDVSPEGEVRSGESRVAALSADNVCAEENAPDHRLSPGTRGQSCSGVKALFESGMLSNLAAAEADRGGPADPPPRARLSGGL